MKASVRPLISSAFTGALIWGFVVGRIDAVVFVPIAAGAIAWWFYDRNKEKKIETPK